MIVLHISGGSRISHWGGTDPLGVPTSNAYTFQQKMYVKTKEIDPVGGAHAGSAPLDPPMHMILIEFQISMTMA